MNIFIVANFFLLLVNFLFFIRTLRKIKKIEKNICSSKNGRNCDKKIRESNGDSSNQEFASSDNNNDSSKFISEKPKLFTTSTNPNESRELEIEAEPFNNSQILNINNLNVYCLFTIFKFLPTEDRLKIGTVCKKWKIICKVSWSDIKNFEIDEYQFCCTKNKKKWYIQFFKSFGNYLKKVTIILDDFVNHYEILTRTTNYLKNIQILQINGENCKKHFSDKELDFLFTNFPKLRAIYLNKLSINGSCFSSLSKNKIEEFGIKDCNFISEEYLSDFIPQLVNLKKLEMKCHKAQADCIIDSLILSNHEDLIDFSLDDCISNFSNALLLLCKQKKLEKFSCSLITNEEDFHSLPADCIREINIDRLHNSESSAISRFKNLTVLTVQIECLTDEFMKDLAECEFLKKLIVKYSTYKLSSEGEKCFTSLKKLEHFNFMRGYFSKNFSQDKVLTSISKSKKLEYLNIPGYKPVKFGFTKICLLENLIILNLSDTNVTEECLIILLLSSLNLKKLGLINCKKVSKNFINVAYEIKYARNDSHILQIFCKGIKKTNFRIKDSIFSLISISLSTDFDELF